MSGCASTHYTRTPAGTIQGKLVVEWYQPDLFLYRPDSGHPLTFTRAHAAAVRPEAMYTDGGSVPRPFWAFRNYSPWGYGPAFIVHDWLFHMQNCRLPGYEAYTVKEAAVVMSEVMKTLMEAPGFDYGSKSSVYLMYKAVQTPPAVNAWKNGKCVTPADVRAGLTPDATFVVEFP